MKKRRTIRLILFSLALTVFLFSGSRLLSYYRETMAGEAAARELKRLDAVPIPSADRVSAELAELTARKDALYAEYNASKQQLRELETIKQNLDSLLLVQREQEPRRSYEIE